MAINLNLNQNDVEVSLRNSAKIHYIPATIHGDGPAKVEQYFECYTDVLDDKTLVNALRGFPLRGKHFTLPTGFNGVIFQETKKPLSTDEDRNFSFAGAFKEFTYWNFDKIPSKNDAFVKALDWMELSQVLHEPLATDEDSKEAVKDEK
ncbi:uncharacterized protein LOC135711032 [Ochlerotatus camptorhynchus]|uniref:uncharacterized protein LOC135711032 n=1 Tax=Ochlerotatus camptorhynchus TaxID=644619 RepID=UPI0031DB1A5D